MTQVSGDLQFFPHLYSVGRPLDLVLALMDGGRGSRDFELLSSHRLDDRC